MLGIYEKRRFTDGEKIWLGSYRNLTNVLHWHFECEIIRVIKGNAEIKIGDFCFATKENDCFFCAGEELHYIISKTDTLMDVMIFDEKIVRGIADKYVLATPKLSDNTAIQKGFEQIKKELSAKESFYYHVWKNTEVKPNRRALRMEQYGLYHSRRLLGRGPDAYYICR